MRAFRRPRRIGAGALALALLLTGATGCGGGDDSSEESGKATTPTVDTTPAPAGAPIRARVDEITSCLKKAGQGVEQPNTKSPGSTVLSVPLQPAGKLALIYVYGSPAEASKAEEGVSRFFKLRGGSARATGDVVLAQNLKTLPAGQAKKIEACL